MPNERKIDPDMRYAADAETRRTIEEIVSRFLDGHDAEPCNIFVRVDDDGEETIEIGVCYRFSERPVDTEFTYNMSVEISKALMEKGDSRTPYLRTYFDPDQSIKGFKRAC